MIWLAFALGAVTGAFVVLVVILVIGVIIDVDDRRVGGDRPREIDLTNLRGRR